MIKMQQWVKQLTVILLVITGICDGNAPPRIITDLNGQAINENTPVSTVIGRMLAEDPEGNAINYQLSGENFRIDQRNGDVTLTKTLDYETARTVTAVLRVNSFDDPVQIVTRTVTFRVIDVNDNAPTFTTDVFGGAADEGAPNGTVVVATVAATDVDGAGAGLRVECDRDNIPSQFTGVCDLFEVRATQRIQVVRWQGEIVLRGRLSFREKTIWQIPLKAFDGVFTTRASAEIQVNDIQNEPPIFTSSMNIQVIEFFAGAQISAVRAVDQDNTNTRSIIYNITSNPGNLFRITTDFSNGFGFIFNVRNLDRDRDPALSDGFVSVGLLAREVINMTAGIYGNDSSTTATATMIINIRGINDNSPTFSRNISYVNLPEDSPNGSPLPGLSITVTDADQGSDAVFGINMTTHSDIFDVHPTSGRELANLGVRVKDSSKLDYDGDVKNLTIILVAYETEAVGFRFTSSTSIFVSLVDVNDITPKFGQSSYTFSVSETATAGTVVTSGITVTDGDTGVFGTAGIRYRLVGNGAEKFTILDNSKPEVSVASCAGTLGLGPACLDMETQSSYSLFLVASDNLGGGNSNTTALRIQLTDENDNTPSFSAASGFYEFFINEGDTSGTPVFQVSASDADSSLNGNNRVQYSLVGENGTAYSGLWQILSGGVITATRPVDFEAIPGLTGRYQLFVQAQDSAPPFRRSVVRVVINVIDQNDNAPTFTLSSPVRVSIVEGPNPSRHLTDLVASDGDLSSSANGRISYTIASGSRDRFVIDINNGTLSTTATANFQYEVQSTYVLTVVAQDGGRPQLQASLQVIVLIIDVNNKLPNFPQNPKRVQVLENVPIGSPVTQMAAIDQDASAVLQYSVVSVDYRRPDTSAAPNNVTFFDVDSTTANVTVALTLNRDVVSDATLVIRVIDTNATSPQTATASLIIVVLDVNDQGPTFASPWTAAMPFYNVSMDEEEPVGSFVMVLTATDPDGPISEYRIVDDPAAAFTVSSTGAVSLRGRLDFEARETTSFTMEAVDSGAPALSATATVSVQIVNVNDVTPAFSSSQYNFRLLESNGTGVTAIRANERLGVVNATDTDRGDFGRVSFRVVSDIFFLIASSDAGAELFINGSAVVDREVRSQLVVQLQVSDSPGNPAVRRATSVPVYVNLDDVNDNAPTFVVSDYYVTIGSNSANGSAIATIAATDVDINSTLRYSLTSSTVSGLFAIDSVSGAVTTAASLSDRAGSLNMQAVVNDGIYTATCTIHVTVLESSRAPPTWLFPGINDTLQLLEEQYRGLIVTRLRASEDNSTSSGVTRLTFGIIFNGDFVQETPLFRVNPVTGVLTANAIFDREATSRHLLNVAVRDQRTPPLEARRLITIDVIDVDDNAPRFVLPSYSFSVAEGVAVNSSIGQVTASDADFGENAVVRYEIVTGNVGGAFSIDATIGRIFVTSPLDRETTSSYSLRVAALSGTRAASVSGTNVAIVTVTVVDVNDNLPQFSSVSYYGSVPFSSPFNQLVATVSASDPDYAENAQVVFGIADERRLLQIDATGRVSLANLVPAASTAAHTAVLSAWNQNRPSMSSSATVSVWFSSDSSVARLVIGESPDWVTQHLGLLLAQVKAAMNATQVFANRVRYHVDKAGSQQVGKTDVLVTVVGSDMTLQSGASVSAAVRQRAAKAGTSASLQFLKLESASTYNEDADQLDVSLPIILSVSVLAAMLIGTAAYIVALYFMQKSLAASCQQQAASNGLNVLQIQGVQKRNPAYDNSAFN